MPPVKDQMLIVELYCCCHMISHVSQHDDVLEECEESVDSTLAPIVVSYEEVSCQQNGRNVDDE